MTTEAQFRAVLTSKYDEGLAHVKDFVVRNGDDEMAVLLTRFIRETESNNPDAMLRGYLSIIGLLAAWLAVIDERENDKPEETGT